MNKKKSHSKHLNANGSRLKSNAGRPKKWVPNLSEKEKEERLKRWGQI